MEKLALLRDTDRAGEELLKRLDGFFLKGGRIAVKLHMGEKHNPYFLKPERIKKMVDALLKLGLKPFLFDSVVLYKGARDTVEKYIKTAESHGFTEKSMGCPIAISETGVDVKTEDLVIHVCKELSEADGMLVVSHVKGHCCYGFGGAIKNLGMGGVTPASKNDIHVAEKGIPTDKLLAEGAQAVLSFFSKVYYVNFLINISKECDCCNNAGPILVDDIGALFGRDIVAIDQASLDLINMAKKDVFMKVHSHDPQLQITYAKELGLGDDKYELG